MAGVTITLPDSLATKCEERARRKGLSLDRWLVLEVLDRLANETRTMAPAGNPWANGSFREIERKKQSASLPVRKLTIF